VKEMVVYRDYHFRVEEKKENKSLLLILNLVLNLLKIKPLKKGVDFIDLSKDRNG